MSNIQMQSVKEFYPYIRLSSDAKEKPPLDELTIDERTYYYLKIFSDFKQLKKKISWNWSAALFGFLWLAYRRMYLYTVVYLLIFYIGYKFLRLQLIMKLMQLNPDLSAENIFKIFQYSNYIKYILLFLLPGLFGNFLYYSFLKKRISKNKTPINGTSIFGLLLFLAIGSLYFSIKVLPGYIKLFTGNSIF